MCRVSLMRLSEFLPRIFKRFDRLEHVECIVCSKHGNDLT